jgi:hypothetical protein
MYFRIIRKTSTWNDHPCTGRSDFLLTASLQDADMRLGPPMVETTGSNTVPLREPGTPKGLCRKVQSPERIPLYSESWRDDVKIYPSECYPWNIQFHPNLWVKGRSSAI